MAGVYETWARRLRFSFAGPGWGSVWGAFAKVLGDNSLRDVRNALLQRLPSFAGADALGFIGTDRTIERGPTETDASYAARLVAAPDQWRLGGTPVGLLVQLYYTGFTNAVILQQNGVAHRITATPNLASLVGLVTVPSWVTRTVLGNNNPAIPASTDGKPAIAPFTVPWAAIEPGPMDAAGNQFCSRFIVIFAGAPDPTLGTAANLSRIRRVIATWRAARSLCAGIYVASAASVWDWPGARLWDDGAGAWWDTGTYAFYSAEA